MKLPLNVEPSTTRGDYVGYGAGYVWRISSRGSGRGWNAWQNLRVHPELQSHQLRVYVGRTLADIASKLGA